MSVLKEFSADAGEFISASDAAKLVEKSHKTKEEAGKKRNSYLHSQFFGKDKLLEVISRAGDDFAGIKISLLLEGGSLDDEGLLIQAVDKKGAVLGGNEGNKVKLPGNGGGGIGLFGGPKCPRTCLPPIDDDN